MYGLFLETLKPLTVTILNDEETNENFFCNKYTEVRIPQKKWDETRKRPKPEGSLFEINFL